MINPRPLPNRVDPFGELRATTARGALLGNRGGKFHRDDQTLGRRRWTNRLWIACVCEFKNRWRPVWGRGYMLRDPGGELAPRFAPEPGGGRLLQSLAASAA